MFLLVSCAHLFPILEPQQILPACQLHSQQETKVRHRLAFITHFGDWQYQCPSPGFYQEVNQAVPWDMDPEQVRRRCWWGSSRPCSLARSKWGGSEEQHLPRHPPASSLKAGLRACAQEVTSVPRGRAEVQILLSQHLTTSRRSSPVIPSILLSKRQSHIFKCSFGVESDSGRKLIKCRNYCSIRFLLRSLTQQALGHRARTSGRFLHEGCCSHGLVSKRCPDHGWGACSFCLFLWAISSLLSENI